LEGSSTGKAMRQAVNTTPQTALAEIIAGIGRDDFAARATAAIRGMTGFELATACLHRSRQTSIGLFDDFDRIGCRQGLVNYLTHTHRINPMLTHSGGALRAADFPVRDFDAALAEYLVPAPEEELGFRTIGWPEKLEEIGIYFGCGGGIVELSLYRARGHQRFGDMAALEEISAPIAAAFDRHMALTRRPWMDLLSHREGQIVSLLLQGCDSDAIALRLGISRHTVKDHRKRIFRKLGIGALSELFAMDRQARN
jgi:DNA-binding CsgD family transcriptional regulator